MNRLPPIYDDFYDRPATNPIPGQFHARTHGAHTVHKLGDWLAALTSGDSTKAATVGNELLVAMKKDGATDEVVNGLIAKMQTAVHSMRTSADPGTPGAKGKVEGGIDLYQPDPNFFYVLDQKSGVDLAAVLDDLRYMSRYTRRGARAPSRLLLIGPPGCGKTMGGRWLGAQLGMPVALVRIDATVGSLVGQTAKNVRASFEFARDNKAILLIDEFEAVAVPRNKQGANIGQWVHETTAALLQLLDSLPSEQIVIGATNYIDLVDAAIQRRMRKHIYFGPPNRDARAAMVKKWWALAPHESAAKRVLLDLTEGFSGDVLERIAEEANRMAARRAETADITVADVQAAVIMTLALDAQEQHSPTVPSPEPADLKGTLLVPVSATPATSTP